MQPQYKHNTKLLWGLVAVALVYSYLIYILPTLTGQPLFDGSIGVILGLYICSRPAANMVDMVFFERGAFHWVTSKGAGFIWLVLNLLAFGLGCFVIVSGTIRLVG